MLISSGNLQAPLATELRTRAVLCNSSIAVTRRPPRHTVRIGGAKCNRGGWCVHQAHPVATDLPLPTEVSRVGKPNGSQFMYSSLAPARKLTGAVKAGYGFYERRPMVGVRLLDNLDLEPGLRLGQQPLCDPSSRPCSPPSTDAPWPHILRLLRRHRDYRARRTRQCCLGSSTGRRPA